MAGPVDGILDWLGGAAGGVDWSGAVIVAATGLLMGGLAAAGAIGTAYWIRHTGAASGAGDAASVVAARGLRRLRRAHGTDGTERWLCGGCRSWNAPGSTACYRGCGQRAAMRMLLPGDVSRAPATAASPDEDGVDPGAAPPDGGAAGPVAS